MLRLRFAADHVGHINFPLQYDKCRDFVVKGLLANDEDLGRAFRVIEAELGFLFDFFYARYPSIKDTLAPDLAVYIVILATSLFTLFSPDLLRYQFLAFIFSDWHKVKMLCRYVRNESWQWRSR